KQTRRKKRARGDMMRRPRLGGSCPAPETPPSDRDGRKGDRLPPPRLPAWPICYLRNPTLRPTAQRSRPSTGEICPPPSPRPSNRPERSKRKEKRAYLRLHK